MRTRDLREDNTAVYVERRPLGGGTGEEEWVESSALPWAALERWLDVRKNLVQRAHGTSKLWVSLWMNRLRYDGLRQLLPLKLEALRRAVDAERQRIAA